MTDTARCYFCGKACVDCVEGAFADRVLVVCRSCAFDCCCTVAAKEVPAGDTRRALIQRAWSGGVVHADRPAREAFAALDALLDEAAQALPAAAAQPAEAPDPDPEAEPGSVWNSPEAVLKVQDAWDRRDWERAATMVPLLLIELQVHTGRPIAQLAGVDVDRLARCAVRLLINDIRTVLDDHGLADDARIERAIRLTSPMHQAALRYVEAARGALAGQQQAPATAAAELDDDDLGPKPGEPGWVRPPRHG